MAGGIKFPFESDFPDLASHIEEIGRKGMPSESAKALNRTQTYIRNQVADEVSTRTGISRPLIRRRIKPLRGRRASPKNQRTVGFVGEATIPVGKLKPKPRKAGPGVIYKTVPGQPVNPLAFHATLKNGKSSAWVRKSSARGSLREVQVRIDLYLRRSVRRVIRGPAQDFYFKTFQKNMQTRIDKDLAKRGLKKR